MERAFEIRSLSDPRLLSVVRATTGQIAQVAGFDPQQVQQIKLAVDEVCANIIRHTYKFDPRQEIVLLFALSEHGIEIHIQDFGAKVDPSTLKRPRTDRLEPGGLGIPLIGSIMDKIEFGLPTMVGNTYRLVKYRTPREG
jgi:anti-sigma regulatory factor (Ser/Thr protein kinase)